MIAEFLKSIDACKVWAVRVRVCADTRKAGFDGSCGQQDSIQTELQFGGFAKYSPFNSL